MFGQAHCRGISVLLSFKTRLPFDLLPEWKRVARPAARRAAERPARSRACAPRSSTPPTTATTAAPSAPRPASPTTTGSACSTRPMPPQPDGRRASPRERGMRPGRGDDRPRRSRPTSSSVLPAAHRQPTTTTCSLEIMRHPRTVDDVLRLRRARQPDHGLLDPDPPARHWVREREAFTLEEAVRMITFVPATAWGFADRGLVREGFAADLNVFDPATVAPSCRSSRPTCPAAPGAWCRGRSASWPRSSAARCCCGRQAHRRAARAPAARPARPPRRGE